LFSFVGFVVFVFFAGGLFLGFFVVDGIRTGFRVRSVAWGVRGKGGEGKLTSLAGRHRDIGDGVSGVGAS
jgi:hypothetical protein